MESKKRPHSDDGDAFQVKKRVVTGLSGSPEVNGVRADSAEPTENDQLELFRKDAIFRRMRHYSRENERSQARIAQLEQRKNSCEAGLVAIAACWQQLVETIRTLTLQDDIPAVGVDTQDLFDISQHVTSDFGLKAALEQNMHATQRLVTAFLKSSPVAVDDVYEKFQNTERECTALRSELVVVRKRLEEAEVDVRKYREQLAAAEIRIDRLRSSTVAALQAKSPKEDAMEEDPRPVEGPSPNPSSSPPRPELNGHDYTPTSDLEELHEKLKRREARITLLENDNARLAEEVVKLKIEIETPAVETIAETAHYKLLMDHASQLEHTVGEYTREVSQLNETVDKLRSSRKEFEDETTAASQQAQQELKTLLSKRDADNLRVREARDQYAAELAERKARDSVKLQSWQEVKDLAESRSERITQLQSEIARHKAKLAAHSGDEDLMKYFFEGKVDDMDYVRDLRRKLEKTEMRLVALEQSLSTLQHDRPDVSRHVAAEASAREELAQVSKELTRYRSLLGGVSDASALARQLQDKDTELQQLRLIVDQQSQAESSLCAEVDRLSSSWENLDQQVKKKVFDLTTFEEKLQRTMHEKAKAENKYFAAMREKEMGESERKAMARQLEKQGKAVERALEVEKNLSAQVGDLEKMSVISRRTIEESDKKIRMLEAEVQKLQHVSEADKKRFTEARNYASESTQLQRKLESQVRAAEEEATRVKRETEKKIKKLSAAAAPVGIREEALSQEIEGLWKLMKCSTCKQGMREVVLTKCMHTFCKNCVDTRISTRQRRCPHCNLGFAQSDVQTVYFQ
ncbi:BRE1 E3 ubiquitin ligase-domain-containing protein [Pisolithus croceorrhizus]|nr:BRE1 E3 ubiquitin ligase-domain-containing protein [Pisolithus croceorrhizus]KAI6135750.1 BRE1 E3 ubiquitin ligase-domain-containing protein [Pisolithus croceorrhizus]